MRIKPYTQLATRNGQLRLLAVIVLLLGGGLGGGAATQAAPPRQAPSFGLVGALALDGSGNGWAWAAPAPQTFATSFLLRLEAGAYRVAASTGEDAALLPPGLEVARMALTADGTGGWAVGNVANANGSTPLLWRYQNGEWRVARSSFPADLRLLDLTLSADGSDGWIPATQGTQATARLLRLRNGAWDYVTGPAFAALTHVAISPDGQHGWASGPSSQGPTTLLYQWQEGRWTRAAAPPPSPILQVATALAADNAGDGWMITEPLLNRQPTGELVRLRADHAPTVVALDPITKPGWTRLFHGLTLDGAGRGWVVGAIYAGQYDPNDPLQGPLMFAVLVRLHGDAADEVSEGEVQLPRAISWELTTAATSPDGAHTWAATFDRYGEAELWEFTDPWVHWLDSPRVPELDAPLPGPGRCFDAVPYCLRGKFAAYWAAHGGLQQFGYPITPEITEGQGDQLYTVQYTERARLEYHPTNAPPYDVLLGLLGNSLVDNRLGDAPFQPKPAVTSFDVRWFKETGHNVGPPFLAYWTEHGGLPVFGLPRSEAFEERNAADGQTYLVQYFERNRLEYHPEHRGTPFAMLLGLLGVEEFTRIYEYVP
jgi:hypothetical protein